MQMLPQDSSENNEQFEESPRPKVASQGALSGAIEEPEDQIEDDEENDEERIEIAEQVLLKIAKRMSDIGV